MSAFDFQNLNSRRNALLPPEPDWVWVGGASGQHHLFRLVSYQALDDIPAGVIYIVGRAEQLGTVTNGVLGQCTGVATHGFFVRFGYAGQTGECDDRHSGHEHERDFVAFGANVALIRFESDKAVRLAVETDIRHLYFCPINRQ